MNAKEYAIVGGGVLVIGVGGYLLYQQTQKGKTTAAGTGQTGESATTSGLSDIAGAITQTVKPSVFSGSVKMTAHAILHDGEAPMGNYGNHVSSHWMLVGRKGGETPLPEGLQYKERDGTPPGNFFSKFPWVGLRAPLFTGDPGSSSAGISANYGFRVAYSWPHKGGGNEVLWDERGATVGSFTDVEELGLYCACYTEQFHPSVLHLGAIEGTPLKFKKEGSEFVASYVNNIPPSWKRPGDVTVWGEARCELELNTTKFDTGTIFIGGV